jgi:hypothetical protein
MNPSPAVSAFVFQMPGAAIHSNPFEDGIVKAHSKLPRTAASTTPATVPANPFAFYMDRPTFCDLHKCSMRGAEMMAHKGEGPRVTHIGRRAFYHLDDIQEWLDAQRAKSAARFEAKKAA